MRERLGDLRRQRLDVQLARDLLEHAAALGAGRVVAADELQRHDRVDRDVEVHAQQVDVHRLAAHRVVLGALQDGRRGLAVGDDLEHGAPGGKRVAQLARVGAEGDRVAVASVEDAGDAAAAAQAARGAGALGLARGDGELRRLRGHGDGEG